MKSYYLNIDGNQTGPHTVEELKQMELTDKHLVWTENMPNWMSAKEVLDLRPLTKATPPPLPTNKFQEGRVLIKAIIAGVICFAVVVFIALSYLGYFQEPRDLSKSYDITDCSTFVQVPPGQSIVSFTYDMSHDGEQLKSKLILPLGLSLSLAIALIVSFITYRYSILVEAKRLKF